MKSSTHQNNYGNIRCLLIDLDDTLYPRESGAWDRVRERIDLFLQEEMRFPSDEVPSLRTRLFQQYGTTLRGLQIEFEVDMDHYLNYVHDIHLTDILSPDPQLSQVLDALPQRKVIFTNANAKHATRVIHQLGVQDHFDHIIDIYALYPHCKPEVEAFYKALSIIEEEPHRCLMIDDNTSNLETARTLGIQTVSIGQHQHDGSPHIPNIKALAHLIAP